MPVWQRDTTPRQGGRAFLGFIERSFQSLDLWTQEMSDRILFLERRAAINGIQIRYLWNDDINITIEAPPGTIKGNDAIPANITQFALSRIDEFGREAIIPDLFENPVQDGYFQVADYTRNTLYIYDIAGPVTGRTTDIVLDVTVISAVGAPPQQDDLTEAFYWPQALPHT